VTSENPPQKTKDRKERKEETNRIAAISHRIAEVGPHFKAAIAGLTDQVSVLCKQIQADGKAAEAREKIHQDRSTLWLKWGTIVSTVLSFFSVVTAGLALYVLNKQLDSMNRQVESMQIEQRAWVKIELTAIQIEESKPLIAQLTVKNVGKTPAQQVNAALKVQVVKKESRPDLKLNGVLFTFFAGILNPEGTVPASVPMLKHTTDVLNPPILTKDEISELTSGAAYLVVYGKIEYGDVYGRSHWVQSCNWHSIKPGTYPSRECVQYNNVDKT